MEPSTSSSWNLPINESTYWPNGGFRKRKAAATDLDERINQKMFVTEDKMVKEMQTLSLELAALNDRQNTPPIPSSTIEEDPFIDIDEDHDEPKEGQLEIHQFLKQTLKNDDLQDSVLSKLCENERRRLAMQIVPYMPIHPAQLNTDSMSTKSITTDEVKETKDKEVTSNNLENDDDDDDDDDDDHRFKIPSVPTTPYTVEEPCDGAIKRGSTMKRSYSQSDQYNSNFSVTELKPGGEDYSTAPHSQSAYFIVEPTVNPLTQTISSGSSSSLSSGGPSVRITEIVENPTDTAEFISALDDDDDIDMQSVASSDTGDKMDDD